ncbi:GNAT family N-acetyltransferase [Planococcus shenhongbingii]|uniref:GNAT family N-acetyltransferase n=1 Tax=Planococcus shenhongbingii TaxID=3058398 RepID=A0ABT8NFL5_9BACL|nr:MULTISPECIES: GNAT family N-acetyltransferase [unclassified Planococcus (in: firmicutes)]MDN7246499.1 GNAT family N-acetyltransferase [Planococcus sp. N017]WKA59488.1 GNAT family N-acetyltransferase [Planococcus sp. N016]
MKIIKSDSRHCIENEKGETIAEIRFVPTESNLLIIDQTFVTDSLRGQGIAGRLVASAVDTAREQNKKIIPLCSFAKAEFNKKTEYQAMQANRY